MHDHSWLKSLAGKFIVFEGPDGSGKTTQFRRLMAACNDAGLEVCEVREPGDIYSVGATLYYLLTNKYPFLDFDPHRASSYSMILEHPPVPLRVHRPDAPEGLERVLRTSLAKQPRERWASAHAMGQALRPFLGDAT